MHQFPTSFYAHPLSVVLLGYVRPELNYVSKEKLIEDINEDVRVALRSLGRKEWAKWADARELEVPRDGEAEELKGDEKVEEVSKGVEGLRVGKEEKHDEIEIKLEFG
jgi:riboflavin kinase